ncbi:helix-turn-helix domain-containing protein [Pseudactinotalea sp. Z1748]|uniref:helix-turn-helix domain-containing protein n=1 Tax=Pseudactinotalea sp. Z1748 TaxID=3413027 RepID=UPI003C7C66A3
MDYTTETLTTGEAAAIFHVTPSTIKRWADAGQLPHTRTIGGHLRFVRAELEAIEASNTYPTKEAS